MWYPIEMPNPFDLDLLGGRAVFRRLVDEVLACGAEANRLYRDGVARTVTKKPDRSPVTAADHALELRLRDFVHREFAMAAFVGEETGTSGAKDTALRFLVDPIDGTRAFVRGVPTWSVLVGIEHHGEPVAGIAYMPAKEELFVAVAGDGATVNDAPIELSGIADPAEWSVCHGMLGHFTEVGAGDLLLILAEGTYTQMGAHDFDGYRQVLYGRAEAMVDPGAAPWDLCAAAAIFAEAGGMLTGVDGTPGIYENGCVASNGHVHDALVALLNPQTVEA